jgi:hypothetical protein
VIERTSTRGPHSTHCVPYAQSAGENEPCPPSRQKVSPSATPSHVFWHGLKSAPVLAAYGGGDGSGADGGSGEGGGAA